MPSNEELNAMLARSADELVLFNRLDRELEWPDEQGMQSFTTLLQGMPKPLHLFLIRPSSSQE